jgi:hypothetical protein
MLYQQPELKGNIRIWSEYDETAQQDIIQIEIYLEDKLMAKTDSYNSREKAAEYAKHLAQKIKTKALLEHELQTVGNQLYIKWDTDITKEAKLQGFTGTYTICRKGRIEFPIGNCQTLEEAEKHLAEAKKQEAIDNSYKKLIRY